MGPSCHAANQDQVYASNEHETDVHQLKLGVKSLATSREPINDQLQKSSEVFIIINPTSVLRDTLHTQHPANEGVTKIVGNPNYLFNEIDKVLKEVKPIRLTATKGTFRSTPNLNSCPFKTSIDVGKSSHEEHEELKNNTHPFSLPTRDGKELQD